MILVDTSVWVEFFKTKEPIYSHFDDLLSAGEILSVSWIFGELFQGARAKTEIERLSQFWKFISKPSNSQVKDIWIEAGEMSQKHKWVSKGIGLIDAAIVTTAQRELARVWTLDKKLEQICLTLKILYSPPLS